MKKFLCIIYFLNINTYYMQAQTNATITGEYELRGVMEMASGLLLKSDNTFEFYFSYGAMDRGGSGKWQWNEKDSMLILNTVNRHVSDYALVTSRKGSGRLLEIRITDPNTYLLRYTQLRVHTANGIIEGNADEKGVFTMPVQPVNKIELLFELCPEKISTIDVKDTMHSYFEFRFEPWITDVYFDNVMLKPTANGLEGGHPLLKGHTYQYHKLK
ncbi:MAG: hypothetical protein ABW007_16730 [Chitinophagaceae bacterium]